ncbi:iron-containing alcohol dehydrogenase [Bosea sp. (in: a-proteobacteria)]|uniref:iron-containing alcohol dehydrogenase n=1 Tax=Bosea sp. (in: a-proteobacteria) TaxID=1871050 RepID=UPI002602F39C|nr:iron-containing alcohol dehydrogenase [Bosea sp. (in: a-proteobacteria)]MCO5091684.1 iron-containing alcohol dehydrogenase [Bosea sp. (in: a-proteobacteria)]
MLGFRFHNPTVVHFGQGSIARLAEAVPPEARVLLLFGGGSIKRNGVHAEVRAALEGRHVVEFGGIEPNPVYETIMRAAALARSERVDLILAVGGGSVADAGKFLAAVTPLDPALDPWDHWIENGPPAQVLPVGVVLTLPATGSESNPVSVISHRARGLKLPFASEATRPQFAVLDPSTMASLDRRQRENGVVDAFTHVVEQYLTYDVTAPVQHGFSETLMRVLIEWGPKLVSENSDEARATVMWAANQALNGLIGAGVPQDWSTHMIGHAMTAAYGVDHARTLTAVMPSLLRFKRAEKRGMLLRYARKVWDIAEPDADAAIEDAIARTEAFFRQMGCPARLAELAPVAVDPELIVRHLAEVGQTALGERNDIGLDEARRILALAA